MCRCNGVIRADVGICNEKNGLRVHVWHPLFRFRTKLWKSLLYSIPHFCAFVKLKCDFNQFFAFFQDSDSCRSRSPDLDPIAIRRSQTTAGERAGLSRACSKPRPDYRSARACPSRTFAATQARRGTGPRPTVRGACFERKRLFRSVRTYMSIEKRASHRFQGPLGP